MKTILFVLVLMPLAILGVNQLSFKIKKEFPNAVEKISNKLAFGNMFNLSVIPSGCNVNCFEASSLSELKTKVDTFLNGATFGDAYGDILRISFFGTEPGNKKFSLAIYWTEGLQQDYTPYSSFVAQGASVCEYVTNLNAAMLANPVDPYTEAHAGHITGQPGNAYCGGILIGKGAAPN